MHLPEAAAAPSLPTSSPSPPSLKRKRSSGSMLLTPPLSKTDSSNEETLSRAVNVLSTAATALSQVTILYQSDHVARDGLLRAVNCVSGVQRAGGKLVICGVGKSGFVGRKLVATMKSLGLRAAFLHPVEALHGDLGDVGENDALLFLSYSGKTPELLHLLTHIPAAIPLLAITAHTRVEDCPLLRARGSDGRRGDEQSNGDGLSSEDDADTILLPAPIHESEETSFGISAPTTSTTVAMAVGDMLALTLSEAVHEDEAKKVFHRNHPGGAIGAEARRSNNGSQEASAKRRTEEEKEERGEDEEASAKRHQFSYPFPSPS